MTALKYANLGQEHAAELAELELLSFPKVDPVDLYNEQELRVLATTFPEGNYVVLDGEQVIAMGLGVLLDYDLSEPQHDLAEILGKDGVGNHRQSNDWYYGTDIAVHPNYRGRGIGQELYRLRKQTVRRMGKLGIIAGGVIPGYVDHRADMSAEEYIAKVVAGDLYDATLTFQLGNGFEAIGAISDYLQDETVGNNAAFIVWHNPDLPSLTPHGKSGSSPTI